MEKFIKESSETIVKTTAGVITIRLKDNEMHIKLNDSPWYKWPGENEPEKLKFCKMGVDWAEGQDLSFISCFAVGTRENPQIKEDDEDILQEILDTTPRDYKEIIKALRRVYGKNPISEKEMINLDLKAVNWCWKRGYVAMTIDKSSILTEKGRKILRWIDTKKIPNLQFRKLTKGKDRNGQIC